MSEAVLTLLDGVRYGGSPVPGERSHALLACLTLAAPRAVGVRQLAEHVWPDGEPERPEKALQVLVSRTRSRTSPGTVLHEGTGYRLGLRDDEVDALRLRRLLAAARAAKTAGDLDVVRHAARDALAIPITSAGDGPLATLLAAARSDQEQARRLLGGVLLARGDAVSAFDLLEAALAQDPSDEDLVADLLRAEAETRGVPAALARYAAYAQRTLDEVGAEPGEALRRVHLELLARDAPVREGLKYDASPMIGRDEVVSDLRSLLSESRVVSLVGAGGLGKTRTAHLIGRLAQQPVVHFVELAGVNAPDGVLPEVANALGVRELAAIRAGGRTTDLRSRVAEQLSGPPTLLILDNCEHVITAAADLVAFVVAANVDTTVLTTSRAPLGIAAEKVYLLPQLSDDDAVELFAQRARSARPAVRLDPVQVRALVTRLDGLPLAIELAAAKVRVMSIAEITRRLDDRFALLAGRDRSTPDRHQTLEAVIDWSWNLLPEHDRAALCALAVFPDGFSLGGAKAVLGHDPLPALTELVDQSLLVVREDDDIRYRFLETVREYGLSRLAATGDEAAVRTCLRDWAVSTARALSPRLHTREQVAAVHDVRSEVGNLGGVLRTAMAEGDVSTLVPLTCLLCGFWMIEGDHLTVLGMTDTALELILGEESNSDVRDAELRGALALLTMNRVIFAGLPQPEAIERLRHLLPDKGNPTSSTATLLVEVFGSASAIDEKRLAELTFDPDPHLRRTALQWSAQVAENTGDLNAALTAGEQALALCDEIPDEGPWAEALIRSQLAGLATQLGDWDLCVRMATAAQQTMEELGAVEDSLQLRSILALADLSQGRLDRARQAFAAISADSRADKTFGWSMSLLGKAELALAEGDVDDGLALYRQCIDVAREQPAAIQVLGEFGPWAVYTESSALFAHVVYERPDGVHELADALRVKVGRIFAGLAIRLDYPVLGGALLALGAWDLAGDPDDPEPAVRAFALAKRFAYQRVLPTMRWSNVERIAEKHAPGLLARLDSVYDDRLPSQLHEEAMRCVGENPTPSQSPAVDPY